ncbi:MAG: hypothetical protein JWM06_954 [Actinomycetia bacterium]|jgi:hypothetical protein|nr:hypothetical protein [Actinomycetes bacterium]
MSRIKTKRYLVMLSAIGLIAVGLGSAGTFATFNAETTNNGNYFATGTLLLHNNGGTNTCTSEAAATTNLNNATTNNCDVLFNYPISDTAPHYAQLTLTNAGTLNATNITWSAPGGCATADANVNATLTTALSGTVTALAFTPLVGATISNGGSVTVTYGTNTQTFTASAAAALNSTSVTVSGSQTANFAYPVGSAVHATTSGPAFATANLCPNLQVVIMETNAAGTTNLKCVYGTPNVSDPTTCDFDGLHTLVTPSTGNNVPNSLTALNVLTGGVNTTSLDAGKSRYFKIGVQLASTADNTFQNRAATFALRWHIDT